jgi:hypothetical protein
VVLIPAAVVALLVVGLLGWWAWRSDVFAPTVKAYVTRDAQVLGDIDPTRAIAIGALHRGDAVKGHWIAGRDSKPQWLKVAWAGRGAGFVWARDLSLRARPDLTPSEQPQQTATQSSLVYAEPDAGAAVIDDLAAGENTASVGATADGWTELALQSGGVGYVKAAAFEPVGADGAAPLSPMLASITHYQCRFDPGQGVAAPASTPDLSFYFDEGRACINHTFAYLRGADGGLKRVMLNDRARRMSLLQFSPDRQTFTRTDYTLAADDYARQSRASAALKSIVCPAPGDAASLAGIRSTLTAATPDLDTRAAGASWSRRVWVCTPG